MQTAQESIATYIRAKDENRPYLMTRAFAEAASVEMVVMDWLYGLPYPWCSAQQALVAAPALDDLELIRLYLARGSA